MARIINRIVWSIVIIMAFSCKPSIMAESGDLPPLPIKVVYENSLEYHWSQKKVLESRLLSNLETMAPWEYKGTFGSIKLSDEKPYKGKYALLLESPTKEPLVERPNRPNAGAVYKTNNEDWTAWNRVSFWIYPDLPGFNVVSINMRLFNEGEEKVPDSYDRNGLNFQILENQKWNQVYWEIAHLGREKVTGIEIRYRLQGSDFAATETARFFIDEVYLEKVDADQFEGWNVQKGEIAYNHAGYTKGYSKIAFTSENVGEKFVLKDVNSGKVVKENAVSASVTPLGNYRIMDFSDVNTEGTYVLEVGKLKTKPFIIGSFSNVYRSSIIKTINHFYTQRCGFAVPGVHPPCHLDFMCEHDGKSIPISGGWHDAGDLSQGIVNTAEATYSMMMLAEKLKKTDPVLSDRLLEEAEWGLNWVLRTRFENGFRSVWNVKDMRTDGIIGSNDDLNTTARKDSHANLISATTEAFAAIALKKRDPIIAAHALKCAIEDYKYGTDIDPNGRSRMSVQIAGEALNAALALYEATSDEYYKKSAIQHASYILSCQQQENLAADVPLKGFFYRSPEKVDIIHNAHTSFEQNYVVGLVKLSQLFPSEAVEWKKAVRLYADFYKEICNHTAPYYMIPAGIYDISKARNEVDTEQIRNGVKLNERYYMKRFPVWGEFRGNSATTLSQAKGLATIANFLQDKALSEIAYQAFNWHLGINPFAQSLMYGEGYRFAAQYSAMSGNLVGGLPVGIQTHFNRDAPYWPAENCFNWKEIWVHPSTRWLMLASDFDIL
jgi:Glycosyl hydrolase family 9./N-terminal ig-like domain of cellulase.